MTSAAKHTAGPWRVDTGPKSRGRVISVCKGFPQKPVAQATGQETVDEREANARLIAAAPDLLEALKLCIKELRAVRHGSVGGVPNDIALLIPERIDVAEAAIAKAEGGAA